MRPAGHLSSCKALGNSKKASKAKGCCGWLMLQPGNSGKPRPFMKDPAMAQVEIVTVCDGKRQRKKKYHVLPMGPTAVS